MKTCRKKLHQYESELVRCPECRKESLAIYTQNNRLKIKEKRRKHYLKNKHIESQQHKEWNKRNPGKKKIGYHAWLKRNRDYTKKRYNNELAFRLMSILRSRLNSALKNNRRNGSAVKDLGCSVDELKLHLEIQFTEGMSWENYGIGKNKWSIDHIIALSTVDLNNVEQFKKVTHFTNLRPLWNKDQVRIYHEEQRNK